MYSDNIVVKPIKGKVKVKVEHDDDSEPKIQLEAIEPEESCDVASADAHRKLLEEHKKTKAENSTMFFELQKKNERITTLQAQKNSLSDQLSSLKDENKVLVEESHQAKSELKTLKNENSQLTAVVRQLRKGIDESKRNEDLANDLAGAGSDEQGDETVDQSVDQADDQADDDVFEVEQLLKHRERKGKMQYFVRWVDFDSSHNCWVDEDNLCCAALLKEYRDKTNLK